MTENEKASFKSANAILYCKQWKQTVRFYRDGLELPVLFETDWFVEFGLTAEARLSVADEKKATIKSSAGGGFTLALETGQIQSIWRRMHLAGLKPTPIRPHAWNARVFYLADPEGHRIEVWQAGIA